VPGYLLQVLGYLLREDMVDTVDTVDQMLMWLLIQPDTGTDTGTDATVLDPLVADEGFRDH